MGNVVGLGVEAVVLGTGHSIPGPTMTRTSFGKYDGFVLHEPIPFLEIPKKKYFPMTRD